jgi:hypothetical protein
MKKNISIICTVFTVIFGSFLLSSFSPSLDGRAVVADEGTFPAGLFAKTVGYLPGDSISVTNLATKTTTDILVIGALDPSEGVAILLSPEAASALGIVKGSNIIVKITKRSGQLDEAFSGTAVVAKGDTETPAAEKKEPESAPAEDSSTVSETASAAEPAAETTETPAATSAEPASADTVPAAEPAPEAVKEPAPEAVKEPAPEAVKEPAPEAVKEPVSENAVKTESSDAAPDKTAEEPVDEKAPAESLPATEPVAEKVSAETTAAEVPVEAEKVENEAVKTETTVPEPVAAEKPFTETEEPSAEKISGENPTAANDSEKGVYAPIILVPSNPNPPAGAPDEAAAAESPALSSGEKNISEFDSYVVPDLKSLKTGKYYIQIAVFADQENIRVLVKKYGGRYPIVLVPLEVRKAYEVMIGPFSSDEYGTVIERFRSYGFKDAFLRKIQ